MMSVTLRELRRANMALVANYGRRLTMMEPKASSGTLSRTVLRFIRATGLIGRPS